MQSTIKIVFTSENLTWGGSELLWAKTMLELVNSGNNIAICVHSKLMLPDWILEIENKIIIYRLPVQPISKTKFFFNKFLPYSLRLKSKNYKNEFIAKFQPDLLVINQGFNFNGVELMVFAAQSNINYVTISHAVNEGMWPNLNLRTKMRLGFENSKQNYFVSNDNLQVTQSQIGCELINSKVVRNPFNVPFSTTINYPLKTHYALACVGRYDFNAKGQDVLLRVLAMDKWKSRNLIVNFYGEGRDLDNLKDLLKMYDISNVIVHSHTSTIDIWRENQGLILTSRYEGLPIVIVEAMLCKRLAIVTNVSGNKELLSDNETGFIAAAPRVEFVDEALERAWNVRLNWKLIGEKAQQAIVKEIPENPALVFAHELINIIKQN